VDTKVLKSVIRNINTDTLEDYISIKMEEKVPFEGTKVYEKKDNERVLLAKYEKGKWYDAEGNVFDRFGTMDEVKDVDGVYRQTGVIHTLPEQATRVIQTPNHSAEDAAHPILGHELALSTQFLNDNPEAREYVQVVKKHYDRTIKEYLDELYSYRNNPKKLRDFIYRDLQRGELPSELQQYIEMFPNGEGLLIHNVIKQIIPMVNHRFINNGILKMRQLRRGLATHLSLKPRGGLNINPDSVMVSSDNTVIRNLLSEAVGSNDISTINNWLERNEYWLLIHRQPIQGFTKIQPRKIQRLIDGHGESIFLTEEDVFRLHEGDYDGDKVLIEKVDDELINAYRKLMAIPDYDKRNRTIYLEMFEKGDLGGSLASYTERLKALSRNSRMIAPQGNVVNKKTLLHTLSFKGVKFSIGRIPVEIYNPEDKVVLRYLPLNKEELNNTIDTPYGDMTMKELIVKEGDEIITEGGNSYLRTSKENEFSILLQAAVDDEKFGLLNKIKFTDAGGSEIGLHGWLLTRIFKREGSDDKMLWTRAQIKILNAIYKQFNYSRDRQGIDDKRSIRGINRNVERSKSIASLYYNDAVPGKRTAEEINDAIYREIFNKLYEPDAEGKLKIEPGNMFQDFTTSATNEDLRMTPQEIIVSSLGARDIIDEAALAETGLELKNPLLMHPDGYADVHAKAMADIQHLWDEDIGNEEVQDSISKGMDLGQKLGQAFYNVFEEAKKVLKEKGITEEQLEMNVVKPEYSEAMQDFMAEYFEEFNNAPDMVQKYATAWFLKGITFQKANGKWEKVDKVLSLLPIYLLHKPTIIEYGKAYAKYVYKPLRKKPRGSELRHVQLTNKFATVKELEGKRCG
jgi:hypothetical protein